jgi:hypothetical protein
MYNEHAKPACEIIYVFGSPNLFCFRFESWSRMIISLNTTASITHNLTGTTAIKLKPSEPIVLTGELNLFAVCSIMNPGWFCRIGSFDVYLSGIKGLDVINGWRPLDHEIYTAIVKIHLFSSCGY